MGLEAILTLTVLLGAVVLFTTERLPVDVIAMLVLASLLVLGLVTPAEALSGFSNQATVTVAAMFVLSAGLSRTGALQHVAQQFSRVRSPALFCLLVMLVVGGMSAFVNNTAAVAVFLPLVLGVAAQNRFSASRVLIPMSYAAQMGGTCTLIGTSTNLLVHAMAQDMGLPGFTLFEFGTFGLIAFAVGTVYVMLVGPFLLPERRSSEITANYELGKYITELRVTESSSLVGKSVEAAKLSENYGVFVLELLRGEEKTWSPRAQTIKADDVLLVRGDWSRLDKLRQDAKLEHDREFTLRDSQFASDDRVLAEALVAPGSRFLGHTLTQLDFQWTYNAVVLAIHRRGEILRTKLRDVPLDVGDILLMLCPEKEMDHLRQNTNFIVISERDQSGSGRKRALIAIATMVAVIGVVAAGILPIVTAAILGCVVLVMLRCIDHEDIYETVDWRVIIMLAGVLPLGIAMQKSGAAQEIVHYAMDMFGSRGPLFALNTVYLLTAILTALMSNNATAVLMVPIAAATASAMGVSPTPFLVAVAFAASTSFATPIGYQTNTMVYSAGGYRFIDYTKIGLPLNLIFWGISMYFIPQFWPF